MFGLISKKKVAKVLAEAYNQEPHCGGDWATHKCGGNYFDRHITGTITDIRRICFKGADSMSVLPQTVKER